VDIRTTATLDRMTKQCSEVFTDGEETQEQNKFHRPIHSILALRCHPIKGKSKSEILMAG